MFHPHRKRKCITFCKSYCSTVHFRRITSTYQPTNAHIISHKTLLKHFKTLRHVSILSDHHQGALFLAKVILQYSQFNSYLQTRCCGSILCCVGMCCGAVARCASYDFHSCEAENSVSREYDVGSTKANRLPTFRMNLILSPSRVLPQDS